MKNHTTAARAKADAEFEKVQTQPPERDKVLTEDELKIQARDDNMARLKSSRLARDAVAKAVTSAVRSLWTFRPRS
jgi:hypothetical protein